MKGQTSRLSLGIAKERLREEIIKDPDPLLVAQSLFLLSSLISSHEKVLEAFFDVSHTFEEKTDLSSALLPFPSPLASKILSFLSSLSWSQAEDMAWAANEMGKECLMEGAKGREVLGKVREELEAFQLLTLSFPLLDRSLSDKLSSPSKRSNLCEKLLPEEFEPESRSFAKRCAEEKEGRYSVRLSEAIRGITSFLGEAEIEVRSDFALSPRQAASLKEVYFKKLKKPVHLRQIRDFDLVGGFTVRCGSEVTDMSAKAQLRALYGDMRKKVVLPTKI